METPVHPWYRDAVIYAVDIEKYADSDGDGIGDIPGLIERLGYIESIGASCIWLLPFYPSPRKDNGYDVTDHYRVDPRFGTLEDFQRLVRSAGELGIRIMIDIVMDHTSDEHPWFQAARRDPLSRFRDYYNWADMPATAGFNHGSAFPGEEYSLWKYDEMAGAYYYHPFYRFQPQLNMANGDVRNELMRVLDFWMSFGVAGFRLDAVPLMIGGDVPSVSSPADPHAVLREARETVERHRPGTALMGEVDLAAGRLVGYFGEGDELNALLNFLLNNYLFLALAREKARPLLRGLRLLPKPPSRCQWVNFARNLDELNLQWLPEEDRKFVWETYAPDSDMRIYGRGIRRRLAPMIGDARKLEMAMSLLFALPGTPMLVYGDEIGMGEDLSLAGRDAVRTPMQWTAGRNAGFSGAPAKALVRPLVSDGDYAYRRVNVAAQTDDESSLLNLVRRLALTRRACPEIGRGVWHVLDTKSDAVLGYQCIWRNGMVALFHNFSDAEKTELLDLSDHRGEHVHQLLPDGAEPSLVDGQRYRVTLPPYGYAWYRVVEDPVTAGEVPCG